MNIPNKQQIHFICGFWEKEMKFKPIIKIMVLAAFEKEKKPEHIMIFFLLKNEVYFLFNIV
jgi:hypothetical protein